jgi:hypothetical protein
MVIIWCGRSVQTFVALPSIMLSSPVWTLALLVYLTTTYAPHLGDLECLVESEIISQNSDL